MTLLMMHHLKNFMKVHCTHPIKGLNERSFQTLSPLALSFCSKQVHKLENIGQHWVQLLETLL